MKALNASKIFQNMLMMMLSDVKINVIMLIMCCIIFSCVEGPRT